MNKLIQYAVMAVVGVLVFTALLVPVVSEGMKTAGDPVTYENIPGASGELYVTEDVSGTHTVNMTAPNEYMTIDGVDIALTDTTRGFYIITDKLSVVQTGAVAVVYWEGGSAQYNPAWGRIIEITYDNGTATMNYTTGGTTTTYTYEYSWIGVKVAEGGNYVNVSSSSPVYTNGLKDIIAMGLYASGENDTYYVVKDGKITISDPTLYTSSISLSNEATVDGTTDINRAYPVIAVGNETFTPYIWLVQKEINGHATSGATYDMLGIIPLLVIVGLIMGVVGVVVTRRLD